MPVICRSGGALVLACAVMVAAASTPAPCLALPMTFTFDSVRESKPTTVSLNGASPIHVEGRLRDVTSTAIENTFTFTAGSTSFAMSAAWLVAPLENRTVGVNIDVFDFINTLVVSDTFTGVVGNQATSQFVASGLTPGATYTLHFTGTALQAGRYVLDLVDGSVPPAAVPPIPVVTPVVNQLVFDTHNGTKNLGVNITPGTSFRIDGILPDEKEAGITDSFTFVLTSDTLSAGIEWIVAAGAQRTVGVNVDIVDALNNVVASDTFMGLLDGQAFSQFVATGLSPGTYRLLFTGTAALGGRYHIDLSTDRTPPGFAPIVDAAVPEPSPLLLLALGSALLLALRAPSGRHKALR